MNLFSNRFLLIIVVIALILSGYSVSNYFGYSYQRIIIPMVFNNPSQEKSFSRKQIKINSSLPFTTKTFFDDAKNDLISDILLNYSSNSSNYQKDNSVSSIETSAAYTEMVSANNGHVDYHNEASFQSQHIPITHSLIFNTHQYAQDDSKNQMDVSKVNQQPFFSTFFSSNIQTTFSNAETVRFLANNTLTIASEMTDFNNPMLIAPEGNPGDPGIIPIGDGIYVFLFLLAGYSFVKMRIRFFIAKESNKE